MGKLIGNASKLHCNRPLYKNKATPTFSVICSWEIYSCKGQNHNATDWWSLRCREHHKIRVQVGIGLICCTSPKHVGILRTSDSRTMKEEEVWYILGFKTALTQWRYRWCLEKPTNHNGDKICKMHNHGKGFSSPRLSKRLEVVLW